MSPIELLIIAACLMAGGLIKGATGAGAPLLAVPAIAAVVDVQFAVAIMVIPNLITNLWQMWQYRAQQPGRRFLVLIVVGGMVGVAIGTWLLTALPTRTLTIGIALVVLIYVAMRLARPHWRIGKRLAEILALPAGFAGGALQGATGISAPVSITFLNAIGLARPVFIFTISTLFVTFVLVQIVALGFVGILTLELAGLSLFAVIPLLGAMPIGAALAKRLPAWMFDRLILILLAGLSVKLLFDAFV